MRALRRALCGIVQQLLGERSQARRGTVEEQRLRYCLEAQEDVGQRYVPATAVDGPASLQPCDARVGARASSERGGGSVVCKFAARLWRQKVPSRGRS